MQFLNNISLFFFVLATTTQMYAGFLGAYGLNVILYLIYFIGLISYFILNFKKLKLFFLDFLIIAFSVIYVSTIIYTINGDFKTKLLLLIILPFYYFNGKIMILKGDYDKFSFYFILIVLFSDIYIFYQLLRNNLIYHIYYWYSDAILKVDYLTMSMFSFVALVLLISKSIIRVKIIKILLILFFSFMILVSGARFSILFLLVVSLIYFFYKIKNKKMFLYTNLFILFIIGYGYLNQHNIEKNFSYTIERLNSMFGNDNSIQTRDVLIEQSLGYINESPIFGYGINSSENLLILKYPHNMFLETWLESGILNTLILFIIILNILYMAWRLFKSNIDKYNFVIVLYLILSYLKSFTIAEGKLLFLYFGIICAEFLEYKKKDKNED